jgi:hypothetical protein
MTTPFVRGMTNGALEPVDSFSVPVRSDLIANFKTFATLPASPSMGDAYVVSDSPSNAPVSTFLTAGGGSNYVLVYWNGSAWRSFPYDLAGAQQPWIPYVPAISSLGGALTAATISSQGLYKRLGRTVLFQLDVAITDKGTGSPTGQVIATLPLGPTAASAIAQIGEIGFGKAGYGIIGGGGQTVRMSDYANGTFWVNGNRLIATGFYEI